MLRHRTTLVVVIVVAAVVVGIAAYAVAQPPQPGGDRGPGGPGFEGGPGMGGPPPMPPAIAVTAKAVFVASGHRIYKLDADTLDLVAEGEIPRPEPPVRPGQ